VKRTWRSLALGAPTCPAQRQQRQNSSHPKNSQGRSDDGRPSGGNWNDSRASRVSASNAEAQPPITLRSLPACRPGRTPGIKRPPLTGTGQAGSDAIAPTIARLPQRRPDWTRAGTTTTPTPHRTQQSCWHPKPCNRVHENTNGALGKYPKGNMSDTGNTLPSPDQYTPQTRREPATYNILGVEIPSIGDGAGHRSWDKRQLAFFLKTHWCNS